MILQSLSLVNYKNLESKFFEFNEKVNCLTGANGAGKTTVLDAIYHLSFGKSYLNSITSQNVRYGADFFRIEGLYEKANQSEKIKISYKKGQKKVIQRNGKAYTLINKHIGFLPLVMISPTDEDLIRDGSSTRRKFIDGVIAQSDSVYLQNLLAYTKILSQRNALLKYFASNSCFDADALAIYNAQLDTYGTKIFEKRKAFLDFFIPIFVDRYRELSSDLETVSIGYQSQISKGMLSDLLRQEQKRDLMLQYTTVGIHKDDLIFKLGGYPIKKRGSQGQQKSFLIALKLAQYEFLRIKQQTNPIVLLDDIFDKLDENRVAKLLNLVNNEDFGQLFISDTHPIRTKSMVAQTTKTYALFTM